MTMMNVPTLGRSRILVVEDNKETRAWICETLRSAFDGVEFSAAATFAEAEKLLDSYELENMGPSDAGRKLMEVTQQFIVRKLPARLHGLGPSLTSSLLNEPPLSRALGLPQPRAIAAATVTAVYWLRNLRAHFRKTSTTSWFTPGRPVSAVYPTGYQPGDLGPPQLPEPN